jgi:type VI secretion system protein ImpM
VALSSVGFFGKLPSNGDFLQRRVPQAFLDVWDPWLQESVHASRQALQESWLSTYLTSPLWRFVLPSAVCGSGAYAGLLAPSVDRVGRYFPLTIVTQIDIDACPLDFAAQRASWFEALESLVVAAMAEPNVDLDWFDAEVAGLAAQLDRAEPERLNGLVRLFEDSRFPEQGFAWRTPIDSAAGLQATLNAFAYRELIARLRPVSVWWTEGSAAAAPSWLCLRGLPAPGQFSGMLSGQWTEYGWSDIGGLDGTAAAAAAPPQRRKSVDAAREEPAPALAPRVTLPDAQCSAMETNRAAFVVRPDIGLWATVAIDAAPAAETGAATAVQMIADALQELAPAPSLTGLVESARQKLVEVHAELRRLATRDVLRVESEASVIAMLVAGAECAFLSAGRVQTLRVRARVLETIDAIDAIDAGEATEEAAAPGAGSLMDLVAGTADLPQAIGATGFQDMRVHYERLQREDQWILCARLMIGPLALEHLAATAASGMPISVQLIADTLSGTVAGSIVPMMTLEL